MSIADLNMEEARKRMKALYGENKKIADILSQAGFQTSLFAEGNKMVFFVCRNLAKPDSLIYGVFDCHFCRLFSVLAKLHGITGILF